MRSLLEWGSSREFLYTNTISCLDQIPGSKIEFSIIPRIKTFMDTTSKTQEIKKIAYRWANENKKIEQAIEKDFGEVQ